MKHPASRILLSFLGLLDRIYGMYSDACLGFEAIQARIEQSTKPDQRGNRIFMSDGDPNNPEAKYKHSVLISEFIDRNKRDGQNQKLLSQSALIFVYSVWDTFVRPKYAEALDKDQTEIRSDIFGDLRHYRHAIVHNNSILEVDTVALKFVPKGELVALSGNQMDELFGMLFEEVSRINFEFAGEAFELPFKRRLNPKNEPLTVKPVERL